MYSSEINIRVRYGETDKMGVVFHGNYPLYYEIGRTELMRSLGLAYRALEGSGIYMPVLNLNIVYLKPAYYDDVLTLRTSVKYLPTSRIKFYYEIYNDMEELVNEGNTELAFIDKKTGKPRRPPEKLMTILKERGLE